MRSAQLSWLAFLTIGVACAVGADSFTPLELGQVKYGGEIGRRMDVTIHNNLLKLDVEKDFIAPFREKKAAGGFVGLGMLLDATVGLAAYSDDPAVKKLKDYLIEESLRHQEADGYIGMIRPENRLWHNWDIHEMSYFAHGLLRDYRLFGNERSLEAAEEILHYIVDGWKKDPERSPDNNAITTRMSVTGFEPALLTAYQLTGDAYYMDALINLRKFDRWDAQIVQGRHGKIGGHAYCHMSRLIGQLWLNRIRPDAQLVEGSRELMDFMVGGDGLVICGTVGFWECWHDTQEGLCQLGETCATAYLLRFWHELLQMDGDSLYGDLMERSVYNALFAAQSPDGRRIRYYVPFEEARVYWPDDTYCCPNNYRRGLSMLPLMAYYTAGGGPVVNLYTASTATVPLGGDLTVRLEQTTDYPSSGKVAIRVSPSREAEFPVRLRIPRWCDEATVAVNGEALEERPQGGRFHVLSRTWKEGDTIELDMPMTARFVKGRKAQSGRAAVMHGPVVFCLSGEDSAKYDTRALRRLTLDISTLEGPFPDESVRPGGLAFRVKAWDAEDNYPFATPANTLTLTEYPDPGTRQTYFRVNNRQDERLVEDELVNIELK